VKVRVGNYSEGAIYDMTIELLDWDWAENPKEPFVALLLPTIRPKTESGEAEIRIDELKQPEQGYKSAPIRITFRDSANRSWRRSPDGTLERKVRKKWQRERI
jgi:hypothetical protein